MTDLRPELYVGREQTYVKHFVLEYYLEKLAYKVGWSGATLNYIDGFAGPWQSQDEKLEDTSPHIALRVLRSTRDALAVRGRSKFVVRAMFVEREKKNQRALEASLASVRDVEVVVRQGEFEAHIAEAVAFGRAGSGSFCFSFIDPCGWTGYGLPAITPLLLVQPGEVLINFMTYAVNEWIDDPRPQTATTFEDLYGSTTFRDAWVGLHGLDREEAMVDAYCKRIQEHGRYTHVASAVILNPLQARAHYHLVYATRHDEGLKTFREAERAALRKQEEMRTGAQQRNRQERTGGQSELFEADALARPYIDELRARYHARAQKLVREVLISRRAVPFDELAVSAMQHPMTSEQDVRDFLMEEVKGSRVAIDGLIGKQRTPQWNEGHVARCTGA